ncbi:MAG TPA: phospholipid carrier-dependent glycosyltransferase [Candidatus Moranbacteria bacterium]|nr:phospholipid carrier-dependent glycosyltransferase [Candidatus Moranbacteria bacterium]
MNLKNEKAIVVIFFLASVILFFAFGLYHLTKFETTDEHLWKYGRIKQYWQAIENKDWKKTYINDKPGVTIALFSGSALLFEPNPETHKIVDPIATQGGLFTLFDTSKTELINLLFRLPILLLSVLSLPLLLWLAFKAFDFWWLALFSVMFLSLNPVIVGISQIINPDSFLWIFASLSIFSFLAFQNKREKKFLILAGIFSGFSILSKYTAVTLFLFYLLAILAKIIFDDPKNSPKTDYKFLGKEFLNVALIFAIAIAIFSVLLPAVFVKPEYLLKGISQFINKDNFLIGAFLVFILGAIIFFKKNIFEQLVGFLRKKRSVIIILVSLMFFLVIIPIFLNVWSGQKAIPFDLLRDAAYANEPKEFNFGKLLANDGVIEKNIKLLLMEFYPFVFSLTPLGLLLVIFLSYRSFSGKLTNRTFSVLFFTLSFFLIYFTATLFTKVVTNVRYSIILYPLFSILSAVALIEFLEVLKSKNKKILILSACLIFFTSFYSLWSIRPFYFSYANSMLPKKFTINNSWGHGSYEAAQYLNSLPDAQNKIIWSNTATICQFFHGKCLNSRKIDLNIVRPDYFVISKRGDLKVKKRFVFTNPDFTGKDSGYYFEKMKTDYEWALFIDGRPDNFVKIIKFEN